MTADPDLSPRENLVLRPGGRLVHRDRSAAGLGGRDVTDDALAYLFEPVALADGVRLRDVFLLCEAAEMLQFVLARDWGAEFVAEAFAGPAKPYDAAYSPDNIEYLEVYPAWRRNSRTNEYGGINRWEFHGVGFELADDIVEHDCVTQARGTRVNWSVSMSPVRELIDIPLRVRQTASVTEDNDQSQDFLCEVAEARVGAPTLGQLLHAIFWELSFYGGPVEQQAHRQEIQELVDKLDLDLAETRPAQVTDGADR